MVASSISYPLCNWLLGACMSVACDNDHPLRSSMFQPSKRQNQRAWPKKLVSTLSRNVYGAGHHTSNLISSFCGPSVQNWMSSCLSFETYGEFYCKSQRLSSSLALFGDNICLLIGSKSASLNQWRRGRNGSNMAVAAAVQAEKDVMLKNTPDVKQGRRVVVTGMGVVTSIGQDTDTFYNNLLGGVSGITEIEGFDCSEFPTKIAGEIKSFSSDGWVSPKVSKRADKFVLYLLTAGKKALVDAGITDQSIGGIDKTRCGVIIGSAMGGMKVFSDAIEALRVSYKKMNPFCIPFATSNIGSAILAMDLGWMGPNYSISSACATSNFCILNSANHITRGETDLMLCGGSDATIIPIGVAGFAACRTLSRRNSDPTKASRPWDIGRDGFVLGEGAGVLVLEELEHAKRRGAKIYAEFLGGSFSCDAYHTTTPHPDGTGMTLCMEQALAQSGVAREEVNYINAHAASTQTGDLGEYQALVRCFGNNPELGVNSTKSMIGHLLGASGAVEAVATVKAIQTGWVHPNINLENPDKDLDMNLMIGPKMERKDIKVALSNSFGFGGQNSSILFAPLR